MSSLVSYAQNFEDVMLWRALKNVENGFYIDIGAQDPVIDSVSLAFHEHGWTGIHVEPTPRYAQLLREQRPRDVVLEVAIGTGPNLISFFEIPDTGISTASAEIAEQHRGRGFGVREITVPCIKLSAIFETCRDREIHWMKVDVEGLEFEVLKSWGKAKARPWILLVESTLPLTQIESHQKWEMLLTKRGYLPVYFDGLNRYYLASERADLKKAFDAPPNVFDGFVLTCNSWPWCTQLKLQIQQAEQKIEVESEASTFRHNAQAADFKVVLESFQAEAAQQLQESLSAKNELGAHLVSIELEAFNAFKAHSADQKALQSEIVRASADIVRLAASLAEKEGAFLSLQHSIELERLALSHEIEKKEREFASAIGKYQFEIDRISQLLTVKLNEVILLGKTHSVRLVELAEESDLRGRELSAQLLETQRLAGQEKAEVLLARDKQIRLTVDEFQKREKSFLEAQELHQKELSTALHTASRREQEFASQILAMYGQVDAFRAEQSRCQDDQMRRQVDERRDSEKMRLQLVESFQADLRATDAERRGIELLFIEQRDTSLQLKERLSQELFSQIKLVEEFKNRSAVAEAEARLMRESFFWRITSSIRGFFVTSILVTPSKTQPNENRSKDALQVKSVVPTPTRTFMTNTSSATKLPNSIITDILRYDGSPFIERAFQMLLGRVPEYEISVHYLHRMHTGIPKEQIVAEIIGSDEGQEFLKLIQGAVANEDERTHAAVSVSELLSHHDKAFVNCVYQTILSRAADSDGLTAYLAQLRAGADKMQLIREIRISGECERRRRLISYLNDAVDPKKQTKLLSQQLLSTASVKNAPVGNAKTNTTSAEVDALEEFFTCDDAVFVQQVYLTLLGREPDLQGKNFYMERLIAGVSRVQLISEIIYSNECKKRNAFFKDLDSAIGLASVENDSTSHLNESRIVTAMSAWPLVGWFVRVVVIANKLSHLNNRRIVTKEEMPQLVQHHLDCSRLHDRSEVNHFSDLMWKYAVLDQRLNSVLAQQLPTVLNALDELSRKQDVFESVALPNLLQKLSALNHQLHMLETVHFPNLLQTVSDLNHRQMAADFAKDNLVKVVPVALRKITRDLNDLISRTSAVDRH